MLWQAEVMAVCMTCYSLKKKKKKLVNRSGVTSGEGSLSYALCTVLLWCKNDLVIKFFSLHFVVR